MTNPLPTSADDARSKDMETAAVPASTSSSSEPVELSYAPARRTRGRLLRRVIVTTIALLAVGGLVGWGKPLLSAARLRHWQHACATYTVAPGTLVAASSSPGRRFIAPIPACWTNYTAVAGVPFVSMPGNMPTTVVFMHEMRTPDGRPRIVVVYCNPIYLPSASVVQSLGPVSIDPAKGWSLTSRPAFHGGHVPGGYPAGDNVQLFAGQPDPSDPTRFTMAFIRKGRAGTVDGRLDDDDVVTFQVRW